MEVVLISIGTILLVISFIGASLLVGFLIGLLYGKSYNDKSEENGSRKWIAFQRFVSTKIIHYAKRYYFRYEIIYKGGDGTRESNILLEERVLRYQQGKETAIFSSSPHGLFAISTFFLVGTPDWETGWQSVRPCIHRHVFAIPLLRDFALWIGAIDVSKKHIENMLEKSSILLAPGGTKEMIIDVNNPIQTIHTGFLKIAYANKKLVFPVLHTGQERVFRSSSFRWLDRIRTIVLKHTGYPFPTLFMGPFPSKLTTYVFEPLDPYNYDNEETFIDNYYATIIIYNEEVNK